MKFTLYVGSNKATSQIVDEGYNSGLLSEFKLDRTVSIPKSTKDFKDSMIDLLAENGFNAIIAEDTQSEKFFLIYEDFGGITKFTKIEPFLYPYA